MKSPLILIVVFIGLIVGGVYWIFEIKEKRELLRPDGVEVVKSWALPNKLMEISGIAFLEENRIACVQDEEGTVFIFNTSSSKIEKEINFGKNGDYEGIAIVENSIYVLRSDGTLFEIMDFMENSKAPKVNMYDTPMTEDHNLEGLCYDKANTRLLLVMKESDHENNAYKGIFEFDLTSKKLNTSPIYKLNSNSETKKFRPSEIGVNPLSHKMYVLSAGKNPRIIAFKNGKPMEVYTLNDRVFPQPEGLTFGPNGEIYISTEGVPGKIFQVILKAQ